MAGLYEKAESGGVTTHRHFIYADGQTIAVHERYSNANPDTTNYLHRDYQGSVAVITDSAGTELERFSYDAFGKRRYDDWTADPNDNLYGFRHLSDRAYTGHESLDSTVLTHMNGRVQDPVLGRMISADPTIPMPMNGQSYDRYAYVLNKPMKYTDPSGFEPSDVCMMDGHCRSDMEPRPDDEVNLSKFCPDKDCIANRSEYPENDVLMPRFPLSYLLLDQLDAAQNQGTGTPSTANPISPPARKHVGEASRPRNDTAPISAGNVVVASELGVGATAIVARIAQGNLVGQTRFLSTQLRMALAAGNSQLVAMVKGQMRELANASPAITGRAMRRLATIFRVGGTFSGPVISGFEARRGTAGWSKIALYGIALGGSVASVFVPPLAPAVLVYTTALVTTDVGGALNPITLEIDAYFGN